MGNKIVSGILRKAVFEGKIIKPDKCDKCNLKFDKRKLSGHHNDYSKPFKVEWLCPKCHTFVEESLGHKIQFQKGYDPRRNNDGSKSVAGQFKKGYDPRAILGRFQKGHIPWNKISCQPPHLN